MLLKKRPTIFVKRGTLGKTLGRHWEDIGKGERQEEKEGREGRRDRGMTGRKLKE